MLAVLLLFSFCKKEDEYQALVKRELAKDVRFDSLFLGYELGMSREKFYIHSWKLNKEKKVMQGPGNQSVQYELEDLPHPAVMYFYPVFYSDSVFQMPVRINYKGWAPWNKELGSDSLQVHVLEMLREWHGNGFIKVDTDKNGAPIYVKVDGNRKIAVSQHSESSVLIVYTDLPIEKKLEKEDNS